MGGRTHPDIDLAVRIELHVSKSEQARFVLIRAGDSLDQRLKLHRLKVDPDTNLAKIILDHGPELRSRLRSGIRDERPFHRVSPAVLKGAALQPEAILLQQSHSQLRVETLPRDPAVEPELVRRGDRP